MALSVGGEISIFSEGKSLNLNPQASLPAKPFRLVHVRLHDVRSVTDADLAHLEHCEALASLQLATMNIGDPGVVHLEKLKALKSLQLIADPITDASLTSLAKLTNLEYFALSNTRVGDAGIKQLATLTKLHDLHLRGTKVTIAGVVELQKALPGCTIAWDDADVSSTSTAAPRNGQYKREDESKFASVTGRFRSLTACDNCRASRSRSYWRRWRTPLHPREISRLC